MRLNHERSKMLEQIKDNTEKIKNNKQVPYLVGNVVEVRSPQTRTLSPVLLPDSSTRTTVPDSQH